MGVMKLEPGNAARKSGAHRDWNSKIRGGKKAGLSSQKIPRVAPVAVSAGLPGSSGGGGQAHQDGLGEWFRGWAGSWVGHWGGSCW